MKVDITDCSWKQLIILAEKCGFVLFEGGNHTKVKDENGKKITVIPRHNRLNSHTVRSVIQDFKKAGCQRKEIKHI